MKQILVCLCLLFVYACNTKTNSKISANKEISKDFFEINYESLIKKSEIGFLSRLASNVEYIKLETNENCIIGDSPQFFFTDNFIFVNNVHHILKFSRDGKFLKRIGNSGRGPEDIDLIRTMSILSDQELIVVQKNSEQKLLYFSFNGDFVRAASISRYENVKAQTDGTFIIHETGESGSEKYNFLLINGKGDTLSGVNNNDTWLSSDRISIGIDYPLFEPFYIYKNKYFFKSMYNDTVYHISSNKIIPYYHIKLGKYKLPKELRLEKIFSDRNQYELFRKKSTEYIYCNSFEVADKIFLSSANFKNRDIKYFLFDDKTKNGYLLINEKGESTGFINDWDGGLDFWPRGNIDDKHVYMSVDLVKFQNELEKLKDNKKSVEFPEKQKQLIKMISETDATSNPIIMIVRLQ